MKLDPVKAPDSFEGGVLTRSLISGLPTASAPDGFEQAVLKATHAAPQIPAASYHSAQTKRPFGRAIGYTAATVVALVATLSIWSTSMSTDSPVTSSQPANTQVQQVVAPEAEVKPNTTIGSSTTQATALKSKPKRPAVNRKANQDVGNRGAIAGENPKDE